MKKYPSLQMPYVESFYKGDKQKPTAIIISPSFTTSVKGAAVGIAQTWHRPTSRHDSGHYVVDEETIIRCVSDKVVAGHPHCSDKGAIRITICADPVNTSFWDLDHHGMVLDKTAELVADLLRRHKIKFSYMDELAMRRWERHSWRSRGGIFIGPNAGQWPYDYFTSAVQSHLSKGKANGGNRQRLVSS